MAWWVVQDDVVGRSGWRGESCRVMCRESCSLFPTSSGLEPESRLASPTSSGLAPEFIYFRLACVGQTILLA